MPSILRYSNRYSDIFIGVKNLIILVNTPLQVSDSIVRLTLLNKLLYPDYLVDPDLNSIIYLVKVFYLL